MRILNLARFMHQTFKNFATMKEEIPHCALNDGTTLRPGAVHGGLDLRAMLDCDTVMAPNPESWSEMLISLWGGARMREPLLRGGAFACVASHVIGMATLRGAEQP
jgi:hypothetical protein